MILNLKELVPPIAIKLANNAPIQNQIVALSVIRILFYTMANVKQRS